MMNWASPAFRIFGLILPLVTACACRQPVALNIPPRPLEGRGLENIVAFARLYGYVRYFHPSDEAARADWASFVIAGARKVETATCDSELVLLLDTLFLPLAPSLKIYQTSKPPPQEDYRACDTTKFLAWEHHGVKGDGGSPVYSSQRIADTSTAWSDKFPGPAERYHADLGAGVSCDVPLALCTDTNGTLPRSGSIPPVALPPLFLPTVEDRSTRLADVIVAWNVLQHFHPYLKLTTAEWEGPLRRALTSAATDSSEQMLVFTLRVLVAGVRDGHGSILPLTAGVQDAYALPLLWEWVEDQLVITAVHPSASDRLQRGDVVTAINRSPVEDIIMQREQEVSAATSWHRRWIALSDLRLGKRESVCSLTVHRSPADTLQVAVRRAVRPYDVVEQRPEPLSELSAGVYYIDLTRVSEREFLEYIPRLTSARGIVLDLRGYPHLPPLMLQHLATGVVPSPRFAIPIVVRPDRSAMQHENSQWTLKPLEPHIGARVVCLIDTRAVSQSETWLSIMAQERLAVLVGEPTAGTNGDINVIRLPSKIRMLWTGLAVTNNDGSPVYGVGIVPDRLIHRTVTGIRAGRDEILEAGLAEVSGQPRPD